MTTTLRYALIALGTVAATACAPADTTDEDDTDTDAADTDDTDDTNDTEPGTIVDIASANPDFSILVEALVAADLADTLAGDGPFTVFAPTNDAFEAVGLTDVSGAPVDALTTVLLYHVVSGTVLAADVPGKADSLSPNAWGNNLTLLFDTTSGVEINGDSTVTSADIIASNGVIHVIDTVLSPMDVVDVAVAAGFTSLVTTVGEAANLPPGDVSVLDALKGSDKPRTVFAPTNAAFDEIADVTAGLTGAQKTTVLAYHVIVADDPILSSDLSNGEVTMLSTEEATVDLTGATPTIEGQGIVLTDINATNGVVHVIDGVMIPPSLTP